MWFPPNNFNEDYQRGKEDGFNIAESYLTEITKRFYKEIKKGMLKIMATTSTVSNHKCNCEFCDLDIKKPKK